MPLLFQVIDKFRFTPKRKIIFSLFFTISTKIFKHDVLLSRPTRTHKRTKVMTNHSKGTNILINKDQFRFFKSSILIKIHGQRHQCYLFFFFLVTRWVEVDSTLKDNTSYMIQIQICQKKL